MSRKSKTKLSHKEILKYLEFVPTINHNTIVCDTPKQKVIPRKKSQKKSGHFIDHAVDFQHEQIHDIRR